jgi:uncharacterized membrane protein YdbT with pleckstrin-like domain
MEIEAEKIVYETCPSQMRNLQAFIFSVLGVAAVIVIAILTKNDLVYLGLILPIGYALWKFLEIKSTRLTITDQRLIVSEGVLNKTTNETELYRVRDTSIKEPFFYRMFGLGNIMIFTTDENQATHSFMGYKRPHWLKDQIRNYSEICRQKKRWGTDNILLHDHTSGV